jgi:hypothetical protein
VLPWATRWTQLPKTRVVRTWSRLFPLRTTSSSSFQLYFSFTIVLRFKLALSRNRWISPILQTVTKMIGITIAMFVARIISAVQSGTATKYCVVGKVLSYYCYVFVRSFSAIRGGLMFARNAMQFAAVKGLFGAEKLDLEEVFSKHVFKKQCTLVVCRNAT